MQKSLLSIKTICLLIIGAAIVVRIYSFTVSTNFDADSISRSLIAAGWAHDPAYVWHPNSQTSVWLPLPFYLGGAALMIWDNILLAPRMVSFVLALAALPLMFVLARRLFDRDRAFIAAACLALFTLHIKHGNIASSESLFVFLLVAAMYFYQRLYERPAGFNIIGLAAVMTMIVMTRFEMWILAPFLILMAVILDHPQGTQGKFLLVRSLVFASILPGIFILVWMIGSYQAYGDALYSIHAAAAEHVGLTDAAVDLMGKLRVVAYNSLFWPGVLLISLSPLVLAAGLWGIVLGLTHRVGREWIILCFLILAIYMFQSTIGGDLAPLARYTILPGTILCLFAGGGIYDVAGRIGPVERAWPVAGALLTALAVTLVLSARFIDSPNPYLRKLASVSPVSHYPGSVEPLIRWLSNLPPENTVIFSTPGYESNAAVLYSGISDSQVIPVNENHADAVRERISSRRPDYLVLHPATPFQTALGTRTLLDSLAVGGVVLYRDTTIGEFGIYASRFR